MITLRRLMEKIENMKIKPSHQKSLSYNEFPVLKIYILSEKNGRNNTSLCELT